MASSEGIRREETTVLVTGASGFVAQHVMRVLLEAGYRVRGTVRDPRRAEDLRPLFGEVGNRLEFVPADLGRDEDWPMAVAGCRFVQHVASPFPAHLPKHENDLIAPARDGTLRVLRAAANAGVQRVILTSSIAAIMYGHLDLNERIFTESDWSVLERCAPYQKSKTLAEQAAWEFVKSLPSGSSLELAAINPGFVLGPMLGSDGSTSGELVRKLLVRAVPATVPFSCPAVDVRDVAAAHRAAMEVPEAAGQRFLCASETISMGQIADILRAHYPERRIPTLALPTWLARGLAWFDASLRIVSDELGKVKRFDNSRIRNVLGFRPHSVEEMVLATAESLISRKLA